MKHLLAAFIIATAPTGPRPLQPAPEDAHLIIRGKNADSLGQVLTIMNDQLEEHPGHRPVLFYWSKDGTFRVVLESKIEPVPEIKMGEAL